ncbi:hypothetical protein KIN20_004384 [Parelaphostrongylus tenuis]|uniref:F-actin monooxygenase n=1 Tax=Parelaphostrongylus tenuis TaxID=148309 RepID=A0AAD5QF41_PARTN|nr:hypothetical protein KIN20_004384 [Parelaphostrongylus tenuis]
MSTDALFENYVTASTFRSIQSSFYQLCLALDFDPSDSINVYPNLRLFDYWKAQKLWKLLDRKWDLPVYKNQKPGELLNVFVIGAGPCGLRSAIECALLGARVVLVEQRDRFSRNNVLHLWEFVIQDLKSLGAKIFYPKFCTGSIEHISIRQLQCILLKVALCFGVQVYDSVTFVQILFPKKEDNVVTGFRACLEPKGHILSDYDIDVLIGADGKRNTLPGFPREEMRGKLAIGITANFVNNKTAAEERVPEISGVAYIFNQAFFKEMYDETGVDLENIVYYKDDTHYFVMCAKKHSLLDMGVIRKDNDDVSQLLSFQNIDQEALCRYALAAANFATNGKLPRLEFAKNYRGNEDIAMFDFTSLYSSKCSVRLVERLNKYLLMGVVGDSLHEPFWPTGSGCARGFLGVLDTAWLIREYGINKRGPLEMIAERESIYRLLAQVTKDNMNKMTNKYTIDPKTRYVSLETTLQPEDVVQIVSSDNPRMAPIGQPLVMNNSSSVHDRSTLRMYSLWKFCHHFLSPYKLKMFDMDSCWRDGRSLAGLIARFRPELLDYFQVLSLLNIDDRLKIIFSAVEEGMGVIAPCAPSEWARLKVEAKVSYIEKLVEVIRRDKDRLKLTLLSPRVHIVQKRKCQKMVNSNCKKSEPIQKLAEHLLSCSTFTNDRSLPSTIVTPSRQVVEQKQCQLEGVSFPSERKDDALTVPSQYCYRTLLEQGEDDVKQFTKRPHVDRLNPECVQKVYKIISGDLLREEIDELYAEKERRANRMAQKIPKNDIVEMEKKLERSGMGVLYNKKEHISSQDEKIIRANAAHARKEAENGFTRAEEVERFKDYDIKIAKSNDIMKKRDLAGVDPFGKWCYSDAWPASMSSSPKSVAPVPPVKTISVVKDRNNSVVIRPVAPIHPERHLSAPPVVSTLYDSFGPKRQETCRLCEKVVYLAERIQVESMFVHKNCFRCAYCNQPLRLGEYGKDKDLEDHYPRKLFCTTHLRVPLKEKIARIERDSRIMKKSFSRDQDPRSNTIEVSDGGTPRPLPHYSVTLSFFSPEQLRDKTERRIRDCSAARSISPVPEITSIDDRTPERAEFSNHTRKSDAIEPKEESGPETDSNSSSTSDLEEDVEICENSPGSTRKNAPVPVLETKGDESATEDEDDDLEEGDLEELERTVLQYSDENPERALTEAQVIAVIENINRRRNSRVTSMDNGSEQQVQNESSSPTKLQERDEHPSSCSEDGLHAPIIPSDTSSVQSIVTTPTKFAEASDIMKQKTADLERLRSLSRSKARLKSDEELGLASAYKRRSIAVIDTSTPLSTHPSTVSQPGSEIKIDETIRAVKTEQRKLLQSQVVRSNTGLLSRLFSPDSVRKSDTSPSSDQHVSRDYIHSESQAHSGVVTPETSPSCLSLQRNSSLSCSEADNREVPCAAIAPSPRQETSTLSPSHISVNERNIKLFQKRAEKIRRQHDDERRRVAQEIQRGLEECEIRLEEVKAIGKSLEHRLANDPQNDKVMDSWFALVQEWELLKSREEMLRLSKKEFELEVKYRDLNVRFKQLGEGISENLTANSKLLAAMLSVVEERREVHKLNENAKQNYKKIGLIMKSLKDKG